ADEHADFYQYPNHYSDQHRDQDANQHTDTHEYGDQHADPYANAHAYVDADFDTDPNCACRFELARQRYLYAGRYGVCKPSCDQPRPRPDIDYQWCGCGCQRWKLLHYDFTESGASKSDPSRSHITWIRRPRPSHGGQGLLDRRWCIQPPW